MEKKVKEEEMKCKCPICTLPIDTLIGHAEKNGLRPKILKKVKMMRFLERVMIVLLSMIMTLILEMIVYGDFEIEVLSLRFLLHLFIYFVNYGFLHSINDQTWRDWIREGRV